MAASAQQIRPAAIRLEYGKPQVFALKSLTGKTVPSRYPDPRGGAMEQVVFEATDGAPLYFFSEDASDLQHALIEKDIRAGEAFRITRVKMARGGGSALRIERASDPQPSRGSRPEPVRQRGFQRATPPDDIEARLAESAELLRRDPQMAREVFHAAAQAGVSNQPANSEVHRFPTSAEQPEPLVFTPASVRLCGALKTMLDAMNEGKAYAARLGLELPGEELARLTITAFIQDAREGRH